MSDIFETGSNTNDTLKSSSRRTVAVNTTLPYRRFTTAEITRHLGMESRENRKIAIAKNFHTCPPKLLSPFSEIFGFSYVK